MTLDEPQSAYDESYGGQLLNGKWPRPGSKLRYKGAHTFSFTNIIEDAQKNLEIGAIYTLSKICLASSWAAVALEETGASVYSLGFFEVVDKVLPQTLDQKQC